jgi:hypothetical protein
MRLSTSDVHFTMISLDTSVSCVIHSSGPIMTSSESPLQRFIGPAYVLGEDWQRAAPTRTYAKERAEGGLDPGSNIQNDAVDGIPFSWLSVWIMIFRAPGSRVSEGQQS